MERVLKEPMSMEIKDYQGVVFSISPMKPDEIDDVLALCDYCVGANMYSRKVLEDAIDRPGYYFFVLHSPEGEMAGYNYFFLSNLEEMSEFTKRPVDHLARMSSAEEPVIADIRSLGIAENFRHRGLALAFMGWELEFLKKETSAHVAMGAFWKPNGKYAMEWSLKAFPFQYLEEAPLVWYDTPDLYCPVCKGRCRCDATIYYVQLRGEENG